MGWPTMACLSLNGCSERWDGGGTVHRGLSANCHANRMWRGERATYGMMCMLPRRLRARLATVGATCPAKNVVLQTHHLWDELYVSVQVASLSRNDLFCCNGHPCRRSPPISEPIQETCLDDRVVAQRFQIVAYAVSLFLKVRLKSGIARDRTGC